MSLYEDMISKIAGDTLNWKGRVPGFGATPATAAPAAPAPAALVVAPNMQVGPYLGRTGRMAEQVPTLLKGARGLWGLLGKTAPVIGPAVAGIGEVTGIAESIADPERSGVQTATRAAEGVSRLAGMGAGTGLGFAGGGPWGALAGGALGYVLPEAAFAVRDAFRGGARPDVKPTTTSDARPGDVTADGVTYTPQAVQAMQAALKGPSDWGSFPRETPTSTADTTPLVSSRDPSSFGGLGPMPANATPEQAAQWLNMTNTINRQRAADYQGAQPPGVARFAGAMFGARQAAGAARQRAVQRKLDIAARTLQIDEKTKGATTQKTRLESAAWAERLRLASMESDPAKRASLIGGHALPTPPAAQVPLGIQPLTVDPKRPVANVFNPATGKIQSTPIRSAPPTEDEISNTMKIHKMTREQVIARLKAEGRM